MRPTDARDPESLQQVLVEFKALVREHPSLRDQVVEATRLIDKRRQTLELCLARETLEQGSFIHPHVHEGAPSLTIDFWGLCPTELDGRLRRVPERVSLLFSSPDRPGPGESPDALAQAALAAAIAGIDEERSCLSAEPPERAAMRAERRKKIVDGTHTLRRWRVVAARPARWEDLPDLRDADFDELQSLASDGVWFKRFALFRLGGLHDVSDPYPIVPMPAGDPADPEAIRAMARWRARLPVNAASEHPDRGLLCPGLATAMLSKAQELVATDAFVHAEDFTWIIWRNKKYTFSKGAQAESVRALWDAWERSGRQDGCGLSERTIAEKIGSQNEQFRLAHVFRGHPAWRRVIHPAGKGSFALFRESPEVHSC